MILQKFHLMSQSSFLLFLVVLMSCSSAEPTPTLSAVEQQFIAQAQATISFATDANKPWDGPTSGPLAQEDKFIVYVSVDQKNGGAAGVGRGVDEAAKFIGWRFQLIDAGLTDHKTALQEAIALQPDGLIIGGIDALEIAEEINLAHDQGVTVVGWHIAPDPGPVLGLPVFTNATTHSEEVAKTAAMYAIAHSNGTANVVIFTDTRFQIAVNKSNIMASLIRQCKKCTLLAVEDVALNTTSTTMPEITKKLIEQYPQWNYALGINDLYFDDYQSALQEANILPAGQLFAISAGDGSESAYYRIRHESYQTGTVPEPLLLQGWQLVDELNRAFAGEQPSGYVPSVYLVTKDNVAFNGGEVNIYNPNNGYQEQYKKIWGK